jgi:hypothetical protein
MLRIRYLLAGLALAGVSLSCGDGAGERQDGARQAPVDFGPTAAYERRLVFLGPGQRLPTAAIFDFVAVSDSLGLRRGVRARLADGTEWHRLMDEGWTLDHMREPWRLVPHGPLKLIMGDAGELVALVLRDDLEVRIEPGPPLAGHTPDPGTQLVLRRGRLAIGADLVQGMLLDAQFGRPLDPAAARDATALNGPDGSPAGDDPTPVGRPGNEALLMDNAGFYAVFSASGAGPMAWLHVDGRDDVRRGARLEAIGWEPDEEGLQVPNAWRVVSPAGLTGELVAEAVDGVGMSGVPDLEALGYAIVTGWIRDGGEHRDLFGLIRHAR